MPLSGSAVDTYLLRIERDRLVHLGKHMTQKHLAKEPERAIPLLLRGESVYLRALGANLAAVKEALKAQGVAV